MSWPLRSDHLKGAWARASNSKETIGVIHATPTVVAREVYFGTATFPAFYKLARDGTLCWVYRNPARKTVLPPQEGAPVTAKLRAVASDAGIFCSALVDGNSVYFADTGSVHCFGLPGEDEVEKLGKSDQ